MFILRRPGLTLGILATLVAATAAAGLYFLAAPVVAVAEAVRGPAVEAVYATGTVETELSTRIAPTVRGRIVEVAVAEGDAVRKGDVLVRLDEREAAAHVDELAARARYLDEEHRRTVTLFERGHLSGQARSQAASALQEGEAALAVARKRLDEHRLRAPHDGRVLREDAEVGEVVGPGDVLVWLGGGDLRITAEVDEEDIPRVTVGQTALIKADAFPEESFTGKVKEITPLGDPRSRSYRVRVALPPGTPLRAGMTAEVNVVVREDDAAVLVPLAALDGGYVWVVEDDVVRRQDVTVGVIGGKRVEVREGLAAGAQVVVNPPPKLREGQEVRVRAAAAGMS